MDDVSWNKKPSLYCYAKSPTTQDTFRPISGLVPRLRERLSCTLVKIIISQDHVMCTFSYPQTLRQTYRRCGVCVRTSTTLARYCQEQSPAVCKWRQLEDSTPDMEPSRLSSPCKATRLLVPRTAWLKVCILATFPLALRLHNVWKSFVDITCPRNWEEPHKAVCIVRVYMLCVYIYCGGAFHVIQGLIPKWLQSHSQAITTHFVFPDQLALVLVTLASAIESCTCKNVSLQRSKALLLGGYRYKNVNLENGRNGAEMWYSGMASLAKLIPSFCENENHLNRNVCIQ